MFWRGDANNGLHDFNIIRQIQRDVGSQMVKSFDVSIFEQRNPEKTPRKMQINEFSKLVPVFYAL
ncbi:predicted protein [Sclerotinia sclerotiorum 1980 UF-70]|uniref:Uncharacterized protein n=1 Tax=Sclerotinia sclerotiorum (strain ATCC 18683 / 1980 / Ss-1) TaxID=665079 RepID=A7E923_SCLS1|nr:predicted protein [Sclerotinia sclerotiorum 1980 UF-70]EDN96875.1 predicted protein [Sclerotinia sclerotiorum 1980 UF-70]